MLYGNLKKAKRAENTTLSLLHINQLQMFSALRRKENNTVTFPKIAVKGPKELVAKKGNSGRE